MSGPLSPLYISSRNCIAVEGSDGSSLTCLLIQKLARCNLSKSYSFSKLPKSIKTRQTAAQDGLFQVGMQVII